MSPSNLEAFAATNAASAVAMKWRARHAKLIQSEKRLSASVRASLAGRELPFFDRIVVDETGVDEELAALLARNYNRLGIVASANPSRGEPR